MVSSVKLRLALLVAGRVGVGHPDRVAAIHRRGHIAGAEGRAAVNREGRVASGSRMLTVIAASSLVMSSLGELPAVVGQRNRRLAQSVSSVKLSTWLTLPLPAVSVVGHPDRVVAVHRRGHIAGAEGRGAVDLKAKVASRSGRITVIAASLVIVVARRAAGVVGQRNVGWQSSVSSVKLRRRYLTLPAVSVSACTTVWWPSTVGADIAGAEGGRRRP